MKINVGNDQEASARFAEGLPFSTRNLFTVDLTLPDTWRSDFYTSGAGVSLFEGVWHIHYPKSVTSPWAISHGLRLSRLFGI